jgi:hypothetical protein
MFRFVSFLFFSVVAASACACSDPFGAESIESVANKLLHERKFLDLDAMAAKLRKEPSYSPEGQPAILMMYEGLSKQSDSCAGVESTLAQWDEQGVLLEAWRKAYPKSPTVRIAIGAYQKSRAWFVRGSGYASSVDQPAWEGFAAGMARAKRTLESTVKAGERDAGWYDAMLSIGLAQHWPAGQFDALAEAATQRYPGYLPLYATTSFYHSAKWYGSDEEMSKYVDQAVESTRATMGESLYTRLHHANRSWEMYTSGLVSWPRMKAGWERITSDFPVPHNQNNFGFHACQNKDSEALKQQFERIGERIILANWSSEKMLTYCRALQNGPVECFKRKDNGEFICLPARTPAKGA